MTLDGFLLAFAFAAGAASFFSPCSVGLFPAYIGYYLGSIRTPSNGDFIDPQNEGSAPRGGGFWNPVFDGLKLGGSAALGFFILFLGLGSAVSLVGTRLFAPYLRWVSIGIGVAIIVLGLLMLIGGFPTLHLRLRAPRFRTPLSVFVFGIGYGLASLGCTLPVFLSTLLASLVVAGAPGAFLVLLAYAAGMGLVMIAMTTALSASEGAARAYVRKMVPLVQRGSAGLTVLAGAVVVYFYVVVWR